MVKDKLLMVAALCVGMVCVFDTRAADGKPVAVVLSEAWSPSNHTGWPNGEIGNLIDNKTATKFCGPTNKKWPILVQLELAPGTMARLTEYALTAADDVPKRDPKSWTVEGSNDGDTWSTIDARQNQPVMKRLATSIFTVETKESFSTFRFTFKANHGAPGFQLSGISLKGKVTIVAVPADIDRFVKALSTPTAAQVKSTPARTPVATTYENRVGDWCFRGIVGPLGVMAQRRKIKIGVPARMKRREYRVLSIETGSPAHGRLLPGDLIIGVDGNLFQPGKYVNKEAQKFKAYREPNWEMGRAIQTAYETTKGLLTLTVQRGKEKGTVTVPLGEKPAFSSTYPWNCSRSKQLCKEIADNYLEELHRKGRLEPWRAAWYGLFLLNYDPVTYRKVIHEIVTDVKQKLDDRSLAGQVRGIWNSNNVWQVAFEAIFLSEYAIMAKQQKSLHTDLNRYVQLLFASRMVGNLWGHADNVNYGMMRGGFVGSSSHAALALICLNEAGATVTSREFTKVLDGLSASINKRNGNVSYVSSGDSRAVLPFDWNAIDTNTSQTKGESIMRQGAVHLAMQFSGRMTEAEATYRYMRRQTTVFATHGMTQDAGVYEGARALASCDPKDCRALLDSYLPRLCMSLRWDGGLALIPAGRGGTGDAEYSAYRERGIELYTPAVTGLLLSMPEKRLFLFGKILDPQDKPLAWEARKPRTAINDCSVRALTYGGDSAYFVGPDTATPTKWAVYRHRFQDTGTQATTTAIISDLDESPYELLVWKDKLFVSGTGRKGAVMVWDITTGGPHRVLNSYAHSRASTFTEYQGSLYYLAPQKQVGKNSPYGGGELWRTRDGVTAERVTIIPGNKPLWGLLHGCSSWQTIAPNARSLQVVDLADGPRLFCQTQECSGGNANWTKPVAGGQTMWLSDGTPGNATPFYRRPKEYERWPGQFQVMAVDNNNDRVGSLIGLGFDKRLFFSKQNRLHVSNDQGTGSEVFKLGGKAFKKPNNFSTVTRGGTTVLAFSFEVSRNVRRIAITDGKTLIAEVRAGESDEFTDVRQLTSVGESLYFVGITKAHGAELWHSNGDTTSTTLVHDFQPGPAHSLVENLVALDGKIYFTAWDERHGTELWRHDPKTSQLMVADVVPGKVSSRPQQVKAYGRWIVFAMDTVIDGSPVLRYTDGLPNKRVVFKSIR